MATISKQKKVRKVRQKLKLFRANEPLKSVLMWGINYSFSAMNHVKHRPMLLKDDFKAYMKVKINNYLFNKENMPSRFKFKEYCPMVFKALRYRFGVNKVDYWVSGVFRLPSILHSYVSLVLELNQNVRDSCVIHSISKMYMRSCVFPIT
ncbi:unnamed protein product [Echinostoma caproni]|uniref:PIPK domain-containing protein n=1 Tax=Echinostoma caproni TaxID=27848 RepID=A0A183A1E7_9TREM|nr:unnamed protein product [Echinostoma caproni]